MNKETSLAATGRVDRIVMHRRTRADLNKREPKPAMTLRLLTEAQTGKMGDVSIADALEFRREQYGLTQREFAAILGLQNGHYSEIVNGKRRLPLGATKRAFAIGVPAEVLLQPEMHNVGGKGLAGSWRSRLPASPA